jgi:hypothetical protein
VKKGHTEEQILRALHQAEGGAKVADICRASARFRKGCSSGAARSVPVIEQGGCPWKPMAAGPQTEATDEFQRDACASR